MEKWRHSLFGDTLVPSPEYEDLDHVKCVMSIIDGPIECDDPITKAALYIRRSALQRSILESLMIADDCDHYEIYDLTGINQEIILRYEYLFFRINDAFFSKIDLLDFIETGIATYTESEDKEMLTLFLLKRWTMSLGKEFIVWKFRLASTEYSADRLYSVVMKEAFFYHKEKSMGNTDISLTEYLRSTSVLLSSVKNSTAIKSSSEEDAGLDILDQLDIIVEEVAAPAIVLKEIDGVEFLNNALSQETI